MQAAPADPETELATGRLVLLHDPAGHEAWQGTFRVVTYVRAALELEMAADPLLPGVGWAWLIEALDGHGAAFVAASGTVTRVASESFGAIAGEKSSAQIEIRASWTPLDEAYDAHLLAWCDLLCTTAGLPPVPAGVVALPSAAHGGSAPLWRLLHRPRRFRWTVAGPMHTGLLVPGTARHGTTLITGRLAWPGRSDRSGAPVTALVDRHGLPHPGGRRFTAMVVVASPFVRERLVRSLQALGAVEVVEAGSLAEARVRARGAGPATCASSTARCPTARASRWWASCARSAGPAALVLSSAEDPYTVRAALAAGVRAFLVTRLARPRRRRAGGARPGRPRPAPRGHRRRGALRPRGRGPPARRRRPLEQGHR